MDYLYKESTISNPVDTVLILGENILMHHHSTIKIFDHKMNLLKKRYFYEKILTVKKINEATIAILFDGNKLVECDLSFNPHCLRAVEGTFLDVHNNTCIVYNKNAIQFFNVSSHESKELRFTSLGIHGVFHASFMKNYVPMLLVLSCQKYISTCSIVNLDGTPTKIDSFDVLDDILSIKATEKVIAFANRNFIQIKYKRESFVFPLNTNIDSSVLLESLKANLIIPTYDDSSEAKSIFLENVHVFFDEDTIMLLNGNGELFRISMKLEVKKILGVHISFEGKFNKPSCIDQSDNIVCVGSKTDDTVLYSLEHNKEEKKVEMVELSRVENAGLIETYSMKNTVLATTKAVYKATTSIDLLIYKKLKAEMKISKMFMMGTDIIAFAQGKAFKVSQELIIEPLNVFENLKLTEKDGYRFVEGKNESLNVFNNEVLIKTFSGVNAWYYGNEMLALVRKGVFEFISLSSLKPFFSSGKILEFENEIFNEEIITSCEIEEIFQKERDALKRLDSSGFSQERIVEIAIAKSSLYYLFFRTTKQLYIYSYSSTKMTKVFISKPLTFGNETQALFDLNACFYCRSKRPCIIVFDREVYFYDATLKLGYPIFFNGWIFAISKGHLLKCRFEDTKPLMFTDSFVLTRMYNVADDPPAIKELSNRINSNPQPTMTVTSENSDINIKKEDPIKKDVIEEYRDMHDIKRLVSLEDCNIVALAHYTPFFYHPFIPMVHMSAGPDGKPHSEPINKEEIEFTNKNPSLHGRTLQYAIELRSTDFKLISRTMMEENEFISDMKIMFNSFLVICTSFPEGEDKMTSGKLHVFSLVNIVPDPKNPHITKKLKPICTESFKNPCICCAEVRSHIAVCIGTRLMIYEFNENTGLAAIGRNEISLLCTSLFVTKNLIAVSDIYNGIYFFFLRPRDPLKLHLLGRTCKVYNSRLLSGIDFSAPDTDTQQLSLISFARGGTIHVFTYSPYHPSSKNGNLLIKRAEIVTKLRYPLYQCNVGLLNQHESVFFSSNVMIKLSAIKVSKIHSIHNCISGFVDNCSGIDVRYYLETEGYLNPECKSVVSESVLLEFFYFRPEVQTKICEALGMDYFSVASTIEICLTAFLARK
ncbi:mRNA cleavage and polyadenylation factor subunit [Glugoides intestinalis]